MGGWVLLLGFVVLLFFDRLDLLVCWLSRFVRNAGALFYYEANGQRLSYRRGMDLGRVGG